jgi:hypothetical protein
MSEKRRFICSGVQLRLVMRVMEGTASGLREEAAYPGVASTVCSLWEGHCNSSAEGAPSAGSGAAFRCNQWPAHAIANGTAGRDPVRWLSTPNSAKRRCKWFRAGAAAGVRHRLRSRKRVGSTRSLLAALKAVPERAPTIRARRARYGAVAVILKETASRRVPLPCMVDGSFRVDRQPRFAKC